MIYPIGGRNRSSVRRVLSVDFCSPRFGNFDPWAGASTHTSFRSLNNHNGNGSHFSSLITAIGPETSLQRINLLVLTGADRDAGRLPLG